MKKAFLFFLSLAVILVFFGQLAASSVKAADPAPANFLGNPLAGQTSGSGKSLDFKKTGVPVTTIIGRVMQGVIGVVGAAAFLMVVYAGFTWLFSQGNEEKTGTAKKTLIWAILGLLLVFGAYALVDFTLKSVVSSTTVQDNGDAGF